MKTALVAVSALALAAVASTASAQTGPNWTGF